MVPELSLKEVDEIVETRNKEISYQRCLCEADVVVEAEKARRLRLQMLLAMDENDDLNSCLAHDDERIYELEQHRDRLQTQLETQSKLLERARSDLRIKIREVETLKVELSSLQVVSAESSKILADKLALSREVFSLRPEVEHLRVQAASNQSLLSEKLFLQRQLSAIQVELENEKRSTQRAIAKDGDRLAGDAKLESQLQAIQTELVKERRERQKFERDSHKLAAEFEGKKTVLESRLEAFRNKLRLTKEQLKDSQLEAQSRTASLKLLAGNRASETAELISRKSRKRTIAQVEADTMIGTPGIQPAAKRGKRASTVPGEKSTFSITPFLNRTGSVAPQTPLQSPLEGFQETTITNGRKPSPDVNKISPSVKATRSAAKEENITTTETISASSKVNAKASSKSLSRTGAIPTLEKVTEADEEQENEDSIPPNGKACINQSRKSESNEPAIVKKKRKMLGGGLGRTLFDEEGGDVPKADRTLFGNARVLGISSRPGLGVPAARLGSREKAGPVVGFGAFSPLKKDRKVASTLAE